MKKIFSVVLVILLTVLLFLSCAKQVSFNAKVLSVTGSTAEICTLDENNKEYVNDLYTFTIPEGETLKEGDLITVYFTGDIMESHPAQINVIKTEKLK